MLKEIEKLLADSNAHESVRIKFTTFTLEESVNVNMALNSFSGLPNSWSPPPPTDFYYILSPPAGAAQYLLTEE